MDQRSRLEAVGRALRLLRLRRGRKQYEVAAAAEVTKAMLSAYETGKRLPSVGTLGSLLDALDADLVDLDRALAADQRQDELLGTAAASPEAPDAADPAGADRPYALDSPVPRSEIAEVAEVYRVLGVSRPLPADLERAYAEMLHGFHALLRYFYRRSVR